ncbi:membrane protein [Paenibacillus darwinianus]|uniref:Membrane protein n=1 Tax=Paenibacillus darwinianus TaxID=1380763 RepID=A0A9W5S291_9BACL|nr:outer membrane lipoprotein-sorting protein [Paenibacillus darwinianus]EXX86075.1 membrane protein [Paenibacillus darwinianus]EXX86366.1 membrane protein [Paenibacillus darwinianus]EXX90869.1 membrane protein [Paenibacillus darwinianus]
MRRMMRLAAIVVGISILIAGCGVKNAESVVKDLDKVVGGLESYQGSGTMTLYTGQQPLEYQVEVWYQKPQNYRIALTNAKKDITQIVLRNEEGVFVLTPKLNKSFRFQSDWPQNQGQVYLYQTLVQSILVDNSRQFVSDKEAYVFDVMANYNNGSLARQKIWLNKQTYAPQRVEVSDSNANVMVQVQFNEFKFDAKFDPKAFDMAYNMGVQQPSPQTDQPSSAQPENGVNGADGAENPQTDGQVPDDAGAEDRQTDGYVPDGNGVQNEATDGSVPEPDGAGNKATDGQANDPNEATDGNVPAEDGAKNGADSADAGQTDFTVMQPSYFPEGVALKDMDEVTEGGTKTVWMRFTGTYDYTLIQSKPRDQAASYTPGFMVDLGFTVGQMSGEEQQTLTWTYDGYAYRLTSASLPEDEMVKIAQSVMSELDK